MGGSVYKVDTLSNLYIYNHIDYIISTIKSTVKYIIAQFIAAKNPKLDTRISFFFSFFSVTLRGPPLDSETGWTGELWSKTNLLNWQN